MSCKRENIGFTTGSGKERSTQSMSELLEKILDNRNIVYADGIYWENMRRIFVWEVCEGEIDFRLHSIYDVFRRLVRTAEKHNDKG